jgi:hypothetical protein
MQIPSFQYFRTVPTEVLVFGVLGRWHMLRFTGGAKSDANPLIRPCRTSAFGLGYGNVVCCAILHFVSSEGQCSAL